MSWPQYAAPLIIDIKPSRSVRWFMIGLTGATALFALVLPLSWWLRTLICMSIVAYGLLCLWRLQRPASDNDLIQVVWDDAGLWWGLNAKGDRKEVRLLDSTYVQRFVVILHLQDLVTKRRFYPILMSDNCDPETFRRLRVRLRHEPNEI